MVQLVNMKLAILIEGEQNSGKTTTIRALVNKYSGRKLVQMKRGWQHLFLNPKFTSLRQICYCLPSSPSERGVKIGEFLKGLNPEVLIVAEQPSGVNYADTYSYLKSKGYSIVTFKITNKLGSGLWERFDSVSKKSKLNGRADEMIDAIKTFITSSHII